jgi:hypothetical protein
MTTLFISHYICFSEADAMADDDELRNNWEVFGQPQFTKISTSEEEVRRYAKTAVELELTDTDELPANELEWLGDECFHDGEKVAVIAVQEVTL